MHSAAQCIDAELIVPLAFHVSTASTCQLSFAQMFQAHLEGGVEMRVRPSYPVSPITTATMEGCLEVISRATSEDELNALVAAIERRRSILQGKSVGAAAAISTIAALVPPTTTGQPPSSPTVETRQEWQGRLLATANHPTSTQLVAAGLPPHAGSVNRVPSEVEASFTQTELNAYHVAKVEDVMESADTADAIRAHHRNVEAANDVTLKGQRLSVKRRRSLLPTRANFWKEMINRSIFSGTQGDQTNLKADEEHVALAREQFLSAAENDRVHSFFEDSHMVWHCYPGPVDAMSRTENGLFCLLPGEDGRLWASAGPLGALSALKHVQSTKRGNLSQIEVLTLAGLSVLSGQHFSFRCANGGGSSAARDFLYVSRPGLEPVVGEMFVVEISLALGAVIVHDAQLYPTPAPWNAGLYMATSAEGKAASRSDRIKIHHYIYRIYIILRID